MKNTAIRTDQYTLSSAEIDRLLAVQHEILVRGLSPVDPGFYEAFADAGDRLPEGPHAFLREFRDNPASTVCQVHGFPVNDSLAGPTPAHWERPEGYRSTIESDIYQAMCATALGVPFAWATLQYGRLIQDVFPIRGDEWCESGHGSDGFLQFHTDDAYRPDSCDYLLLFGVRNPDVVPTYVAAVRDVQLSDSDRTVLAKKRFYIRPDDEHIRQLELRVPGDPALLRAIEARDRPEPVAVLSGDAENPRIRLDVPFMRCAGQGGRATGALGRLLSELGRVRRPLVAAQGTLLVINNCTVVHGRESFRARYDGTDRWLRKIIVARDPSGRDGGPASHVRL